MVRRMPPPPVCRYRSAVSPARARRSRPLEGSSAIRIGASPMVAANATRWAMPPERVWGNEADASARPRDASRARSVRRAARLSAGIVALASHCSFSLEGAGNLDRGGLSALPPGRRRYRSPVRPSVRNASLYDFPGRYQPSGRERLRALEPNSRNNGQRRRLAGDVRGSAARCDSQRQRLLARRGKRLTGETPDRRFDGSVPTRRAATACA